MHTTFKIFLCFFMFEIYFLDNISALKESKAHHHVRRSYLENDVLKNKKQARKAPEKKIETYKSFQPISIKYNKVLYPRIEDHTDYDITSYDTDYGGVISNFTSNMYEDQENSELYPNPDIFIRNKQVSKGNEKVLIEAEVDLPDDSLADADLKDHDVIDSVNYLYGFNNCHGGAKNRWTILIFVTSAIAIAFVVTAIAWLKWSLHAQEFRRSSRLYPIVVNLCCCLVACTILYIQAVMGASTQAQCERIALVLHYTHVSCAIWIVTLAAAVTEYCAFDVFLPLKCIYLFAYGVPAVVVMLNYALSVEQYEIKHYCWMSIERGMVMGFMVPAMTLIIVNTAIAIVGLQSVNRKQLELLTAKLQEVAEVHRIGVTRCCEDPKKASAKTLNGGYSKKSAESLDKEDGVEIDARYLSLSLPNISFDQMEEEHSVCAQVIQDKMADAGLVNMLYMDNLSWKWKYDLDAADLKTYLNLCLVMEPFFAINWVMGVVAIENASHWATPLVYLVLVVTMYAYFTVTVCCTLPIVRYKDALSCCESVVTEPNIVSSRNTDNIPLLDPSIQLPVTTSAPVDSISTISI